MGAETCYTSRPQTPSRISNCGEMVRQEVVRHMEEELRREAQGMRDRLQVPGRKLLVGMKLTTSCQKMLTWTIANLAQPGDQILVLHVCSLPRHAGTTEKEQDLHLQQLANTLHGVLSVYEGLCNLKQIKLQLEIVSGFKVKKVLVEVSRNHGACKLILGSNKHFSIGRSTALGKYCLKRLPCTCTVVIIEHGEIIFDKKGKLENGMARTGMLNVLRKSMRSLGRSKKVASGGSDEPDDPARPSVSLSLMFCESPFDPRASGYQEHSNELFRSSGSSASLLHEDFSTSPVSVLPSEKRNSTSGFEAFRISLSKQPAEVALKSSSANESSSPAVERSDMFLLRDENEEEPEASAEDMPLHNAPPSSLVELSPGEDSESPKIDSSFDNKPSSPAAERSDNVLLRDETEEELEALAEDIPLHDVPSSSLVELAPGKEPEAPSVSEEPEASAEDMPLHNAPPSSLVELSPGEDSEPPTMDSSFDNKPSSPAAERSDNALLRDQTEEELEALAEDIPLHDVPSSSLVELAPGKNPEAPSVSEEPEASGEDMPLHNAPPSSLVELSPGEESESPTIESSFDNKPSSPAAERSDNALLRDQTEEELEALAEDIPLHDVPSSSLVELAPGKEPEAPSVSEDAFIPGWPLMHHTIGFEKNKLIPTSIGRDLSVVDWALQLPQRGRDPLTLPQKLSEAQCDRLFGDIAQIGFITHESRGPSKLVGPSDDFYTAKIRFSIKSPTNRIRSMERFEGDGLSLEQKVDCLCLSRLCKAFSYEDLEAATSSFSQSNVVGRGGGSEVFKGELRDGQLVAVKCLRQGPQAEEELLTDIEINTSLSHVHIVSLLGYCVSSSHLILVYDYLPEGNLEDQLHVGKDAPVLSWDVRYRVAVGIAKALDYLHDGCPRPVIHRDVKASNILLSANFDPQLSDFGLAKWASTNTSHICCNDVVGTFGYLAPEYFMYGRVNDRTDVYSFGVVLLELITGRVPIDTTRTKGQENLVIWARPLLEEKDLDKLVDTRLDGTYDTEQMQIMILAASLCVRQSAQRRPRISQVLELLCADQSESLSLWARHEATVSLDLDESGSSCEWTPNYGQGETDIQTHLALAMLGVDDDITSQCNSSMDIVHSSKYFEDYLEGRFSRSASFED